MCFSATASFVSAAAAGGLGALTLTRVSNAREYPLASIPLLFAAQQAIEGALWLSLQNHWPAAYAAPLAKTFVFIALIVWPVLIPLAVGLMEERRSRRSTIQLLVPIGLLLAAISLNAMWQHPYSAFIANRSICYISSYSYPSTDFAIYMGCTCGPLLISTDRLLKLLGLVVMSGAVASAIFFYMSFISVWCFFAAAASVAVYLVLERRHAKDRLPVSEGDFRAGLI